LFRTSLAELDAAEQVFQDCVGVDPDRIHFRAAAARNVMAAVLFVAANRLVDLLQIAEKHHGEP
jgi:hypothetical protein